MPKPSHCSSNTLHLLEAEVVYTRVRPLVSERASTGPRRENYPTGKRLKRFQRRRRDIVALALLIDAILELFARRSRLLRGVQDDYYPARVTFYRITLPPWLNARWRHVPFLHRGAVLRTAR